MTGVVTPPEVLVVVVTHDSASVVGELLATLPAAMAGLRWRVCVVDSGSRDDTIARVRRAAPSADVREMDGNRGYAAGINAGAAGDHRWDVLLALNPDVRLTPGAGAALVEAVRHPGVGIAGPRLVDPHGRALPSIRRAPSVRGAWAEALLGGARADRWLGIGDVVHAPERYRRDGAAAWLTGAALAISRACFAAVGGLDESFFLYSEETDLCLRASERGYATTFLAGVEAVHLEGEARTSPALWSLLVHNRVRLLRRLRGRPAAEAARLALVVGALLRCGEPTHRAALAGLLRPSRVAATVQQLQGPPQPQPVSSPTGASVSAQRLSHQVLPGRLPSQLK